LLKPNICRVRYPPDGSGHIRRGGLQRRFPFYASTNVRIFHRARGRLGVWRIWPQHVADVGHVRVTVMSESKSASDVAGQWDDLARAAAILARQVRQRAYAPYSHYRVGAVLVAEESSLHEGCNVENSSYGLTICAERSAIVTAVARGHRAFQLLAVATADGAAPCGACLQVLAEFCQDLPILLVKDAGQDQPPQRLSLAQLLPHRFSAAKM
jgi:cytidine deaminase